MSKKKKVAFKKSVGAVFKYTSVCCNAPAKKPELIRTAEDRAAGKFSEGSLGHWRCGQCERPCKVTRSRVKEIEDGNEHAGTGEERAVA